MFVNFYSRVKKLLNSFTVAQTVPEITVNGLVG